MDGILESYGLKRYNLEYKCPGRILNGIAGEIVGDWNMIGRELDVSKKALTICGSLGSPEEKAIAMFDAWGEEKGRGATCLKLADVLYERKKIDTLEKLCKKVKREVDEGRAPTAQEEQKSGPTATDGEFGIYS